MEELFEQLRLRPELDSESESESEVDPNKKDVYTKCDCGYVPKANDNYDYYDDDDDEEVSSEKCPIKLALRNHISFPSFELMTELDDPSTVYYDLEYRGGPKRHWATVLQIKDNISFVRPGIIGVNQFGEEVLVHFYHDNDQFPNTFLWDDLQEENTLAILYPEKKTFFDGSEGIREENLDSCFIFKANLKDLQEEAQKLLNDFDSKKKGPYESTCFTCGIKKKSMNQCGKCKLAKYCSRVRV